MSNKAHYGRKKQDAVVEIGLFDSLLERINAVPDDQVVGQDADIQVGEVEIAPFSIPELKLYKLVSDLGDHARRIQTEIQEKMQAHRILHADPAYDGGECDSSHAEIDRLTEAFSLAKEEYDALGEIFWALLRLKYPGHEHLKISGRFLVEVQKKKDDDSGIPDELQAILGGRDGGGLGRLLGLLQSGGRTARG